MGGCFTEEGGNRKRAEADLASLARETQKTGTIEKIREHQPRSGARASYRLGISCRAVGGNGKSRGAENLSRRLRQDRLNSRCYRGW